MFSKYPFTSRLTGGVEEALDDDVIDDGAADTAVWWWSGSGDELLCAVASATAAAVTGAAFELLFDDIVDEDDEDEGKMCSALLPFRCDTGPFVWSSIMQLPFSLTNGDVIRILRTLAQLLGFLFLQIEEKRFWVSWSPLKSEIYAQ